MTCSVERKGEQSLLPDKYTGIAPPHSDLISHYLICIPYTHSADHFTRASPLRGMSPRNWRSYEGCQQICTDRYRHHDGGVVFYSVHSRSRQTMILNAPISDADCNTGAKTMKFTLIIAVLCIAIWWPLCELWCWNPALNSLI